MKESFSIQLLEKELNSYLKARDKSEKCFQEGSINTEDHQKHINNLDPIIENLTEAIDILTYHRKIK